MYSKLCACRFCFFSTKKSMTFLFLDKRFGPQNPPHETNASVRTRIITMSSSLALSSTLCLGHHGLLGARGKVCPAMNKAKRWPVSEAKGESGARNPPPRRDHRRRHRKAAFMRFPRRQRRRRRQRARRKYQRRKERKKHVIKRVKTRAVTKKRS